MSGITESVVRELMEVTAGSETDPQGPPYNGLLAYALERIESEEHARTVLPLCFELGLLYFAQELMWRAQELAGPGEQYIDVIEELHKLGASDALLNHACHASANWNDLRYEDLAVKLDEALVRFPDAVDTPANLAWHAVFLALRKAVESPEVQANPEAVAFAEKCLQMAKNATGKSSAADAFASIMAEGRRQAASRAASAKNAAGRAWVIEEWRNRKNQRQSKRDFAIKCAPLYSQRFNKPMTPENIEKRWLAGL